MGCLLWLSLSAATLVTASGLSPRRYGALVSRAAWQGDVELDGLEPRADLWAASNVGERGRRTVDLYDPVVGIISNNDVQADDGHATPFPATAGGLWNATEPEASASTSTTGQSSQDGQKSGRKRQLEFPSAGQAFQQEFALVHRLPHSSQINLFNSATTPMSVFSSRTVSTAIHQNHILHMLSSVAQHLMSLIDAHPSSYLVFNRPAVIGRVGGWVLGMMPRRGRKPPLEIILSTVLGLIHATEDLLAESVTLISRGPSDTQNESRGGLGKLWLFYAGAEGQSDGPANDPVEAKQVDPLPLISSVANTNFRTPGPNPFANEVRRPMSPVPTEVPSRTSDFPNRDPLPSGGVQPHSSDEASSSDKRVRFQLGDEAGSSSEASEKVIEVDSNAVLPFVPVEPGWQPGERRKPPEEYPGMARMMERLNIFLQAFERENPGLLDSATEHAKAKNEEKGKGKQPAKTGASDVAEGSSSGAGEHASGSAALPNGAQPGSDEPSSESTDAGPADQDAVDEAAMNGAVTDQSSSTTNNDKDELRH